MAMTSTTRPNTIGTGLAARLAFAISSIPQAIYGRLATQKTMRSLHRLNDYQLEDIGLTRGDIDRMFN